MFKPEPPLLLWLLAQRSARQLRAIGEHDFAEHSHGRALLAGNEGDRDLIAGMQRLWVPAGSSQNCWREGFDRPVYNLAGIILGVQKNLAVGIGPEEFRYGPLKGLWMLYVVIRSPVVREHRNADHQNANDQPETLC